MRYFLLTYDRQRGALLAEAEYGEAEHDLALTARARAVADQIGSPNIEVVLLGAHSRDDLMRTHSRYFRTIKEIVSAG